VRTILIICAVVVLFAAASFLAAYFYGRFVKHAQREPSSALPPADADTLLDRSTAALMATAKGRNGLAMLSRNLDAFAARALAARSAGRSLDLMYYIWHSDLTGRLLAHEVIRAADRGVRVRLLLDDINAHGRDPIYLALDSHPKIEVRLFNPSRARQGALRRGLEMAFRAFSATRRMHNKAWIADGRLAIVGGRNVGDEYFDAAERANYRDLDLMLLGPVVQQTEGVFDAYWNSAPAFPIKALAGKVPSGRRDLGLETLRTRLSDPAAGEAARPYLDRLRERISVVAMFDDGIPIHWTDQARIVADPPEKALGQGRENWLMAALRPVITGAGETLEIASPYFVPGEAGTAALVDLARSGVAVAVLTNSLAATDVVAVHGGYAPCRVPLLEGGVRLFELQPHAQPSDLSLFGSSGASLHTKAFATDRRFGFIGSFNFDPRSASLNTEMGVLFEQRALVQDMGDLFGRETTPRVSYRPYLGEDAKLHWDGEVDGVRKTFDREPEAGSLRRMAAKIVGLLPIRSQL
jgi:putative cardiolipin synthase